MATVTKRADGTANENGRGARGIGPLGIAAANVGRSGWEDRGTNEGTQLLQFISTNRVSESCTGFARETVKLISGFRRTTCWCGVGEETSTHTQECNGNRKSAEHLLITQPDELVCF